MNMVLAVYFSLAAAVSGIISLWHLVFLIRHGHWNNVSMSVNEETDRMPGWVISAAFALLAIASGYGAVLCLQL